jgi:hypothetical protein
LSLLPLAGGNFKARHVSRSHPVPRSCPGTSHASPPPITSASEIRNRVRNYSIGKFYPFPLGLVLGAKPQRLDTTSYPQKWEIGTQPTDEATEGVAGAVLVNFRNVPRSKILPLPSLRRPETNPPLKAERRPSLGHSHHPTTRWLPASPSWHLPVPFRT